MICMFLYTYMPKGIERGQEKSAENNISVSIISLNGVMNALFTITMLIIYRYPTRISFCYFKTNTNLPRQILRIFHL